MVNGAITISHNAAINAQGNQSGGSTNGVPPAAATITASQAASSATFTGAAIGGGQAHANCQPTRLCTLYIKL